MPPCEKSRNQDAFGIQRAATFRACLRSEALVVYGNHLPTVRLTSESFHQVRTRARSSIDERNSTCREKSGGSGRGLPDDGEPGA